MRKILIIAIIICPSVLWSQHSCDSLEDKMQLLFKSQFSLEEAEKIYNEYSKLSCTDKLLAYNFMGFAHYNASNFDKAKEFLIKGEDDFFDKENKPTQFTINQLYTALILIVEKDFESALYHLKRAEKYSIDITDMFVKASIYQNMGLVHTEMDELKTAEEYFDKAVKIGGLDSLNIGYIYQNLAFLYLKKDNSEKTNELINRTKLIWKALDYQKGKYLLSFIESKLSIKKNEFDKALEYLEFGRLVYKDENKLLLGENYMLEAQIQDSIGNVPAKIIALENAILKSDDLSKEQLQIAISDLSKLQEYSKTNEVLAKLIAKLKAQNINQNSINVIRNRIKDTEIKEDESTIETQHRYLFLLSALSILLFSLFIILMKQKRNIQKLNQNLESSKIEIENQVKRLGEKNKELEQFAFVASHDLKSPLSTISSFAELLKKMYNSDKANNYLDIISKSAKNMSAMISELLRYSTLDQKLNIQKINFKDLIEETIQGIDTQISESHSKVIIKDSCNQSIQCDKILFKNVIQNLISNSIIYCKDDEPPKIHISALKVDEKINIKISDNGIGMNESHKNQIFEMFKRLKTKNVEGTGIGLATCKKIVEHHKGTISVESTLGKGSDFIITIPFNVGI